MEKVLNIMLSVALVCCGVGVLVIAVGMYKKQEIHFKHQNIIEIQPKPQQKDTSSYHWSDEYTDNQLREMCREGYLKLK